MNNIKSTLVSCTAMDLSGLSYSLHNDGGGACWLFLRLAHKSIHSFFNSSIYSEVINNTSSNMMLLKCRDPLEIPTGITPYLPYVASYFTHYVVPFLVLGNNYFIIACIFLLCCYMFIAGVFIEVQASKL